MIIPIRRRVTFHPYRFVCAITTKPKTSFRFRSYKTPEEAVERLANLECTIWQAARATTAAPTFFEPIEIGRQSFVDGAMGLNNPVEEVFNEARSIWPDAISRIQCIVSIGTGVTNLPDLGNNLREVIDTLKAISTETEDTEKRFFGNQESLGICGRYFRYNVQNLGGVGLDEHREVGRIITATESYLEEQRIKITIDAFLAGRSSNDCM
jgi:Patatin-like phospholipase